MSTPLTEEKYLEYIEMIKSRYATVDERFNKIDKKLEEISIKLEDLKKD